MRYVALGLVLAVAWGCGPAQLTVGGAKTRHVYVAKTEAGHLISFEVPSRFALHEAPDDLMPYTATFSAENGDSMRISYGSDYPSDITKTQIKNLEASIERGAKKGVEGLPSGTYASYKAFVDERMRPTISHLGHGTWIKDNAHVTIQYNSKDTALETINTDLKVVLKSAFYDDSAQDLGKINAHHGLEVTPIWTVSDFPKNRNLHRATHARDTDR